MKRIVLSLFLWLAAIAVIGQTNGSDFTSANNAYQQKDYAKAIELYESILAEGTYSLALYYNLGNAYYRNGNVAKAILYYERALKIAPADQQILQNLSIVRSQLQDVQVGIKQSKIVELWHALQNKQSSKGWSWIAILLIWLGAAGLAVWLFSTNRTRKKQGFFVGWTLIILSILPFLFAAGRYHDQYKSGEAIIMVAETTLKAGPEQDSKTVQLLHEGTKVRMVDQIGQWNKVQLEDTTEGWLPKDTTERI
jgi:tetratricopeptide (TPR) repeat protein